MSPLEGSMPSDVAILKEWKKDHQEEHILMWKKFDKVEEDSRMFLKSITELKTMMTVYTGIAALLGGMLGQVIARYLK